MKAIDAAAGTPACCSSTRCRRSPAAATRSARRAWSARSAGAASPAPRSRPTSSRRARSPTCGPSTPAATPSTASASRPAASDGRHPVQKVWDAHEVRPADARAGDPLVDLHLVHEVTSPQAFDGLRLAGRRVRRPDRTLATVNHNVPTIGREAGIADPCRPRRWRRSSATAPSSASRCSRCAAPAGHRPRDRPEMGVTQPGMTIVCGDSHTSSRRVCVRGARLRHRHQRGRAVLATQTLTQSAAAGRYGIASRARPASASAPRTSSSARWRDRRRRRQGRVASSTPAGAIRARSMEGRWTVCNMTHRGRRPRGDDARPPDETTFAWLEGRPGAPADFAAAVERWRELPSDGDARFDREVRVDAASLSRPRSPGAPPRHGRPGHRQRAGARGLRRPGRPRRRPAGASSMALGGRGGDRGHRPRRVLDRLVHQRPPPDLRAAASVVRAARRRRSGRWSCPAPCR